MNRGQIPASRATELGWVNRRSLLSVHDQEGPSALLLTVYWLLFTNEKIAPAAAYLPKASQPQYCRCGAVSRPCSGWERVGPARRWPPEQINVQQFSVRCRHTRRRLPAFVNVRTFTAKESTEVRMGVAVPRNRCLIGAVLRLCFSLASNLEPRYSMSKVEPKTKASAISTAQL